MLGLAVPHAKFKRRIGFRGQDGVAGRGSCVDLGFFVGGAFEFGVFVMIITISFFDF